MSLARGLQGGAHCLGGLSWTGGEHTQGNRDWQGCVGASEARMGAAVIGAACLPPAC